MVVQIPQLAIITPMPQMMMAAVSIHKVLYPSMISSIRWIKANIATNLCMIRSAGQHKARSQLKTLHIQIFIFRMRVPALMLGFMSMDIQLHHQLLERILL